jgi:hypothetical protein
VTPTSDNRSALVEASEKADMLARVERNIGETLNRIERDMDRRITRHEQEDAAFHTTVTKNTELFEVRVRALEDVKTRGGGVWWVLAAFLGVIGSICCIVVANTALDEIRATRQQLWAQPGRKP